MGEERSEKELRARLIREYSTYLKIRKQKWNNLERNWKGPGNELRTKLLTILRMEFRGNEKDPETSF